MTASDRGEISPQTPSPVRKKCQAGIARDSVIMEASVRFRGADAPSRRPSESLSHSGTAEEKTDIGGNITGNTRKRQSNTMPR